MPPVSPASRWTIRAVVLAAFAATLWFAGPRALDVVSARLDASARNSPLVELDQVGFVDRPEWLDKPLLLAVAASLSPWLSDQVPILDDATILALRDGLRSVPWVHDVRIERSFPDRLQVQLGLRRPVLAVREGSGQPLCLVDRDGRMLPWVDVSLPTTFLFAEGGAATMPVALGEIASDQRVRAAAAIAVEWRDELAPTVPRCPALLEVDATNLGERWLRGPGYPEVRVKLARTDGVGVVFNYDRPVDSPLPRIPVATKAAVLDNILRARPGLEGLVAGDLRFSRRWEEYLQPRATGKRDPYEHWNKLALPLGK